MGGGGGDVTRGYLGIANIIIGERGAIRCYNTGLEKEPGCYFGGARGWDSERMALVLA